jgi:hypothetical protein
MTTLPDLPEMTAAQRRRAAWAAWGLAVVVLVLTPLAALLPEGTLKTGAIILLGVAGTIGTALTRGVRSQVSKAAGAALVVAGLALVATAHAGCGSLAPGYRTVLIVRDVGDQTGKTLANACKIRRLDCTEKHSPGSPQVKECLKTCHEALVTWTRYVRPALNSALAATYAGLETAYAAGKRKTDWRPLLRPGVCALLRAARQCQGNSGLGS